MIIDLIIILGIGIMAAVAIARAESKLWKATAEIRHLKNTAEVETWSLDANRAAAYSAENEAARAKNEALAWKGAAEQARRNAAEVETAYFSALVEIEKLKIENEKLKGKNPL